MVRAKALRYVLQKTGLESGGRILYLYLDEEPYEKYPHPYFEPKNHGSDMKRNYNIWGGYNGYFIGAKVTCYNHRHLPKGIKLLKHLRQNGILTSIETAFENIIMLMDICPQLFRYIDVVVLGVYGRIEKNNIVMGLNSILTPYERYLMGKRFVIRLWPGAYRHLKCMLKIIDVADYVIVMGNLNIKLSDYINTEKIILMEPYSNAGDGINRCLSGQYLFLDSTLRPRLPCAVSTWQTNMGLHKYIKEKNLDNLEYKKLAYVLGYYKNKKIVLRKKSQSLNMCVTCPFGWVIKRLSRKR